jgi:hypothetical protein
LELSAIVELEGEFVWRTPVGKDEDADHDRTGSD